MTEIEFSTEFIKLQQFMKIANIVSSGSDAKLLILDGLVKVNGEVCLQRGRKIYNDYIIEFEGERYKAIKI